MQHFKSLIFCATQRTGSTMVYDDLRNLLGRRSAGNELMYQRIILGQSNLTWPEVWQQIYNITSINEYFIDKVMFHYVPMLSAFMRKGTIEGVDRCLKFAPELFDDFYNCFKEAVWVYVDRRNVFAQAVSMFFAERTQIWSLPVGHPQAAERYADIAYDYSAIKRYLENFLAERQQWQVFFDHYQIKPHRITYEDAIRHYPAYLQPLVDEIGLAPLTPPPPRRLRKVGETLNVNFAEMLKNDLLLELWTRHGLA